MGILGFGLFISGSIGSGEGSGSSFLVIISSGEVGFDGGNIFFINVGEFFFFDFFFSFSFGVVVCDVELVFVFFVMKIGVYI